MQQAIEKIFDFMYQVFEMLNTGANFQFFGTRIYLGWLLLSFVVISIVATAFWRGSKG